ncbi:acyl carrier protein [Variovorax sp.]|uniref:acyl carrier protein n=1 Tax=Variovorax sp. TaxID=1871043 RepID=UPI002D675B3D|nr:acyl carrier protein [Variovorax sp.]HYP83388.1 acyl carrier protein [Variovorax sp.]
MNSLKEIQELIHQKYGFTADEIDPQMSMRDKGFDSLALAEFLFEIEDRLGISLPEPDPQMDTLAELAELVDRARAGAPAA